MAENELRNSDGGGSEHGVVSSGVPGPELSAIASSTNSCAASLATISDSHKKDNTNERFALATSTILIVMYYATYLYNRTHGLPTEGLMNDIIMGVIVAPYGIRPMQWLSTNLPKN